MHHIYCNFGENAKKVIHILGRTLFRFFRICDYNTIIEKKIVKHKENSGKNIYVEEC